MAKARIKMNTKKLEKGVEKSTRRGIETSVMYLEREIKTAMKNTSRLIGTKVKRSGKTRGKGKYHHPSAPGHPPAVDTGRLIGSITHAFSWTGGASKPSGKAKSGDGVSKPLAKTGGDTGVVGSSVKYFMPLEFGTSKMAARPVLRPVMAKSKNKIASFFKAAAR